MLTVGHYVRIFFLWIMYGSQHFFIPLNFVRCKIHYETLWWSVYPNSKWISQFWWPRKNAESIWFNFIELLYLAPKKLLISNENHFVVQTQDASKRQSNKWLISIFCRLQEKVPGRSASCNCIRSISFEWILFLFWESY